MKENSREDRVNILKIECYITINDIADDLRDGKDGVGGIGAKGKKQKVTPM